MIKKELGKYFEKINKWMNGLRKFEIYTYIFVKLFTQKQGCEVKNKFTNSGTAPSL